MSADRLPGNELVLAVTEAAARAIQAIGDDKPQGAFRIKIIPLHNKTDIEFAWDDQYTRDDFLLTVPDCDYDIIMDALAIAYILDEYLLSHDGLRFILSKNPAGAARHQNR